MKIAFTLNGTPRTVYAEPGENVQKLLQGMGVHSVRNSDDFTGVTGSDTILFDGKIVSAGLMIAAQIDGHDIKTVESLTQGNNLSVVQSALVDAGVVQSAYNAPAAALILSDLLDRIENPNRTDIIDAFSGLFVRDSGYQQYFHAVEIARERLANPQHNPQVTEEFRKDLRDVGSVRRKVDGAKLIMGKRAYVEDMVEPGSCVIKMLRSPYAHAYIKDIDVSEAKNTSGVIMVITHKNCPDTYYTQAGQTYPEPSPYDRKMFNQKVRHVGDRVAAVVAETEEIALMAIQKIQIEYDVLTPVFSIEEAASDDAPIIQNGVIEYRVGAPDNLAQQNQSTDPRDGRIIYPFPIGALPHKNIAANRSDGIGHIEKGYAEAQVIVEREYETKQVHCVPCEPHTVYTRMDGDRLVIHASTQVPWHLRRIVARVLGISENKIRIIKERVGGGYGSKQDILLEDVCAFATWRTGRSIFFQLTREEEFIASSTRHPMKINIKLGAKKDGKLTAIYMNVRANTGPFGNHCLTVPMNACAKSLPLILCDNVKFDVTVYYSNIYPTGAYQGYGAPQGSFALQMAMAELAEALGMDPKDLLEKNRVREGVTVEILRCLGEGREGAPARIESCGLDEALSSGAKMIHWSNQELSDDPDLKIGKSVVIVQQASGLPGLDQANARVTLQSDGSLIVHTGGADLGTGLDTVCVKMAAETLFTDMDNVSVVSGDTDHTPFDTGAYASSGTYFSGNAALMAAEDLKLKILESAAEIMDEPVEFLSLAYPSAVQGKSCRVTFEEIARREEKGHGRGQLVGRASFTTEHGAFPYGAHFCQVGVNTRTGEIKVQKYYALQDCGTPINPELAEGQVYGGVLKSIGHSLWEEMKMDEEGACLNSNMWDYGVPLIGDIPEDFRVKLVYTNDPFGPFGAKSVAEVSTNGAAPAIAIAIHDAIGLWLRDWPFTPEKILRALGKI